MGPNQTYKLLLTINKMKRPGTEWEKIFANYVIDEGLISKIYKQLIQINNKQTKPIRLKNGQKILIDTSPKKTVGT